MYQNLKAGNEALESVHLCDYPQADDSLIEGRLSEETDALLELDVPRGGRQVAAAELLKLSGIDQDLHLAVRPDGEDVGDLQAHGRHPAHRVLAEQH